MALTAIFVQLRFCFPVFWFSCQELRCSRERFVGGHALRGPTIKSVRV